MSEENNIIPIGSIVKITTDKSLGDLALYVNYGVVDKYTSAGESNLEHYDVLAIFEDQQQDSFCYYPRQLEIVHPEEVAPNLWNSVADKLDSSEKINLAHLILEQYPILEEDSNLLYSFSWADSKQGHDYWSNINRRINSKKINSFIEEYNQPDNYTETTKIKSDGGSSDYYKLEINGNPVEVEDVIYAMVGGDFALGNSIKAIRRMYLDSKGQGKEGIDMEYDKNKVVYFTNSFVDRFGAKNGN